MSGRLLSTMVQFCSSQKKCQILGFFAFLLCQRLWNTHRYMSYIFLFLEPGEYFSLLTNQNVGPADFSRVDFFLLTEPTTTHSYACCWCPSFSLLHALLSFLAHNEVHCCMTHNSKRIACSWTARQCFFVTTWSGPNFLIQWNPGHSIFHLLLAIQMVHDSKRIFPL